MRRIAVLLADDDAEFTTGLAKLLRRRRFEVEEAADGLQAVRLAQARSFDVALLDVKMPGMDGFETMTAIERVSPPTRFVLWTGHLAEPDVQDGRAVRAFAYLFKPYPIPDLIATLEAAAHEVREEDA